ncbi:MAG: hypothetical protein B1H11_09420 [Desulfobacteraceae bacterium 4484_190.1]|nr:MAG: hypothetical protein B1H11_09420 [Desulfobacteraceae bacterium 4484_190.1]
MFAKNYTHTPGTAWGWSIHAAALSMPVVLVAYLCCHYEPAHSLLGLFLVEWLLVIAAWRLLCPWAGKRGVIIASQLFLFCCLIQYIVVEENIRSYSYNWIWSDELRYVLQARNVVYALQFPAVNLPDAWQAVTDPLYGGWSMAGWPFILGLVTSVISSDPSLELIHAVALSLNTTFITILLSVMFNLLPEYAKAHPWKLFLIFLLLSGDPLVFAAEARKETILQLSLMMAFAFNLKSVQSRYLSLLLGTLGMLVVLTTRPAYLPLLFVIFYWAKTEGTRIPIGYRILIPIIAIALFGGGLLNFQIREIPFIELLGPKVVDVQVVNYGLSRIIYNIPLVGPVAYYLLVPFPVFPWKILEQTFIIKAIIRSLGSLAWFFCFCYVVKSTITNGRKLLKEKRFRYSSVLFFGLFFATVIIASEPRYKQPTNYFLLMMFVLSHSTGRRVVPVVIAGPP